MLKNKEELIKQNIQEVINLQDPIGLMNICPEDEYEPEINEIVEFVICNKNINKISLSEEIRKIFNFYFTSVYNSINEVEEDVASKILEKCENMLQFIKKFKKTALLTLMLKIRSAVNFIIIYPIYQLLIRIEGMLGIMLQH